MKLSECIYGILVQNTETKEIGMVVGVTNNTRDFLTEEQRNPNRAIALVRWQSGRETGIHPVHLTIFKD